MIQFDEVITACMEAFGEQITFLPAIGAPQPGIIGIFNEHSTVTKYQDGDEIIEEQPTLGCQISQFPGQIPQLNDVFAIEGRLWRVSDVVPDGIAHLRIHVMYLNDAQANLPATPPVQPVGIY